MGVSAECLRTPGHCRKLVAMADPVELNWRHIASAPELSDFLEYLTHARTDDEVWLGPFTEDPHVDMYGRLTRAPSGRWQLSGVLLLGDAITSGQLRKVPVGLLENSWNLSSRAAMQRREAIEEDLPPLRRTAKMRPEDFSRVVAEHYRAWAELVPHPVAAMARDSGVNRATVHSWVREARLRGFLPPGREGKTHR